MNSFIKNEISSDFDLIAQDLKRARIEKKLSLEEVSHKTKIDIRYLKILEKGDFFELPQGVYGRSFLKQYASFLDINISGVLEIFDNIKEEKKASNKNLFSNQVVKNKYFLAIPKLFKNILILVVAGVFFTYLVFSINKINSSPFLEVVFPPDDYKTSEKNIEIVGRAEEGAEVFINGENVLISFDGSFKQKINLKTGINEVTVEAKKKYGETMVIKKQILTTE